MGAGPTDESGACDEEAVNQSSAGERFAGGLGLAVSFTVDLFVAPAPPAAPGPRIVCFPGAWSR